MAFTSSVSPSRSLLFIPRGPAVGPHCDSPVNHCFSALKCLFLECCLGRTKGLECNHWTCGGAGPGSASLLLSLWRLSVPACVRNKSLCASDAILARHPADLGKADALFHSVSNFATLPIASAAHCLAGEP